LTNDVNAATFDLSVYDIPETRQFTKMERFWMRHLSVVGLSTVLWKIARFVILVGLSFVILFPFFVQIIDSFKEFEDFLDPTVMYIPRNATFRHVHAVMGQIGGLNLDFGVIPQHISLLFNYLGAGHQEQPHIASIPARQYGEIIENSFLSNSFFMTFWYSGVIAAIQVAICALAGYGFARFKFWGSNLLFFCVILTLIIPPQTLMIPMFVRLRFFLPIGNELHWPTAAIQEYVFNPITGLYSMTSVQTERTMHMNLVNTHWPGILFAITGLGIKNGLYIFMFRQFFKNMPKELEEAAYIDGCSTFQTFKKVMLPSAVALMVTVFLLSFAWQWTDTVFSRFYMGRFGILANTVSGARYPNPEIQIMNAMYLGTAAILAVLPVALVYLVGQRFFIQSVERSGITG